QPAYICLTDDHCWAIADEGGLLAVGRPFTEGADIRDAMAEMEAWALDNGYTLTTPEYSLDEWSLGDLIEPEIFDEVFGEQDEAQDER
ncbi:MAG: hypothetical protein ABI835_16935, partial [Chloroflexota bacterium]